MRTRVVSVLAALAVAVLTFTASPAQPAVLTITGSSASGAVTGHAGATSLTDTSTGVSFTCAGSDATATAENGTYSSGIDIAQVNGLAFANCSGPFGLVCTVTPSGFPWPINLITPISGGWSGTISGIMVHLVCAGCDTTIAGSVPITLTNTSGTNATLTVLAQGDTLKVTAVSATNNCFGLIHAGDVVRFGAAYALTPNTIDITAV